jgi:hypothetical protein
MGPRVLLVPRLSTQFQRSESPASVVHVLALTGPRNARCPRCHQGCADLWLVRNTAHEQVQHFVCRHCTFDWAITEVIDAVGESRSAILPFPRRES